MSLVPAPSTYTSWSAETGARGLHALPCITWWSSLLKSQVKRTLPPFLNPAHEKMQIYRLFLEDNSGTVSNDFLWETVPGEQDSDHSLKVWGGQLWDRGMGCRALGSATGWNRVSKGKERSRIGQGLWNSLNIGRPQQTPLRSPDLGGPLGVVSS